MDTIDFSTSHRDRASVIRQGHIYNLEQKLPSKLFVVATFFHKTKCTCPLQTIGSTVLKSLEAHNHLAEPEVAKEQKAYAELEKRSGICNSQPSLIVTVSMKLEERVIAKFPAIELTK